MATSLNISHLIPYLTWRAPFGNRGILPSIVFTKRHLHQHNKFYNCDSHGFIDPNTHEMVIILGGVQRAEVLMFSNYQSSFHCTTDEIWTNQINDKLIMKFWLDHWSHIVSSSQILLASKSKISQIQHWKQGIYHTNEENPIIDLWTQLDYKNVHFVLKRSENYSFADILRITKGEQGFNVQHLCHFV
eukprot:995446_1